MKVLLDTCVWSGAAERLQTEGHDVVWVGEWPSDPGDEEILAIASRQGRIVVTLDKDFGDLIFARGLAHPGVIRLVGFRATQQGPICSHLLDRYREALDRRSIITAEPWRVRIREP